MNKILIGLSAAIILLTIFYFFDVKIFESQIIEENGAYHKEISLKNAFFSQDLPDYIDVKNLVKIQPTVKSWILFIAIFIGMPIMIALRFGKENKET